MGEAAKGTMEKAAKETMEGIMEATQEKCICRTDTAYPLRMKPLHGMPGRLYYRGQLPAPACSSVAIIGARNCSAYGREMAQWFGSELAAAGVQIISGMAAGVDGIAQRAALSVGGLSFGVLGCGTDICYPQENLELYEALLEQGGGILSEHPAGTPPLARHFPSRNRIISALSDVVLVIEARERSGTLITVDFALEQGRDVYALPGRIRDELSCGCNRLIHQGAGIALSPADILEALSVKDAALSCRRWDGAGNQPGDGMDGRAGEDAVNGAAEQSVRAPADPILRSVWQQLEQRPISAEELLHRIQAAAPERTYRLPELTGYLLELVMGGWAVQERGSRYRQTGASEGSKISLEAKKDKK